MRSGASSGLHTFLVTGLVAATLLLGSLSIGSPAFVTPAAAAPPEPVGWWYDAMRVGSAHDKATGEGATVAIIDGSIDPAVPELRGADVKLRMACRGEKVRSGPGFDADHGTGMAALVAGSGRGNAAGGAGVRGIAPDAEVLFYSVDPTPTSPGERPFIECDGYDSEELVRDAVARGADVLSISLDGLGGDAFEGALREAMDAGVVVLAAAGDTSKARGVSSPADVPGVVAVNAVDRKARPWRFNPSPLPVRGWPVSRIRRSYPVISAPGVAIEMLRWQPEGWRSDVLTDGTSSATALTAGALALVKSRYPEATGNQLVQHLIHNTGSTDGGVHRYEWDPDYGFGVVALHAMLDRDPTGWPDRNPLLEGPTAALRDHPASAYREPVEDGAAGEAVQETAGSSAQQEAAGAQTGDGADGASAAGPSGGLIAGLGALLAVLMGAIGWKLWRRRGVADLDERGART